MPIRLHAGDLLNVLMRPSSCIAAITQETVSKQHMSSAGKQRSGIDYSKCDNLEYTYQFSDDEEGSTASAISKGKNNKTRLTLMPIRNTTSAAC